MKTEIISSFPALTPYGTLRFQEEQTPWQQQLFELGANSVSFEAPLLRYWRKFAKECVNLLCHAARPEAPRAEEAEEVEKLEFSADIQEFLELAPPMGGGEYIDGDALGRIWSSLIKWCAAEIRKSQGIAPFLEKFAPGWHHVGRVFFHLGENRLDNERPFAFLVTYTTGLNDKGKLRHTPLAQALKSQAHNSPAMLRLLEPVSRAAQKIPFVRELCESGAIYNANAWRPQQAYRFLLAAEGLEKLGIGVRLPDWWKKRRRLKVEAEISVKSKSFFGLSSLLDCDMGVALGDETLDDNEIATLLAEKRDGLVLVKNQWVEVDSEKLREALSHWRHIKKAADAGELNFIQGMRLLAGDSALYPADLAALPLDLTDWSTVKAGADLKSLLQQARTDKITPDEPIPALQGSLRPYQLQGVAWLRFLNRLGLGACLADDMGLGKTIQVLALLLLEKDAAKMPTLLVAPASLLSNWKTEWQRFAPSLNVLILHPSELSNAEIQEYSDPERLRPFDLVITSYSMSTRMDWLQEIGWSRIVLDEAQNIKNPGSRQSRAARKLKAPAKIALTGTPIENSLSDLWALFDFINPGLLGNVREFGTILKKLSDSPEGLAPLRKLASPYILRRKKADKTIISDLPDKTEVTLYCNLAREQARLYQRVVEKMRQQLYELSDSPADKAARNIIILQNLMLLKQICNHPAQAGMAGGYNPEKSGKFMRLGELCSEIASRQERVLIFTQFREIIAPLSEYLEKIFGRPGLELHGQTPVKKRGSLVDEFQREDGPPFFILSLKAGGSGLTLTRANHVIHFDRWWNPAVENQATDRCYRIGQKKNVMVHKCLTQGTLEEKIEAMIEDKKHLADQMLDGIENNITALNDAEILKMVSLDARSLME